MTDNPSPANGGNSAPVPSWDDLSLEVRQMDRVVQTLPAIVVVEHYMRTHVTHRLQMVMLSLVFRYIAKIAPRLTADTFRRSIGRRPANVDLSLLAEGASLLTQGASATDYLYMGGIDPDLG